MKTRNKIRKPGASPEEKESMLIANIKSYKDDIPYKECLLNPWF